MASSVTRPVLGASLLSAAASLPLHVMPLLIVGLVADSRLNIAQAGWIASAYMLGQMAVALALPALGFLVLAWRYAAAAVVVLVAAVFVSSQLHSEAMLASWLVIGMACGALQFLGATTAAAAEDKQSAFAIRLGVTLLVGGLAIAGAQAYGGFAAYLRIAVQLAVGFAGLTVVGLLLYRTPRLQLASPQPGKSQPRPDRLLGLGIVFLFFVGQQGFWSYAVQSVHQRGVVLEHIAYAIAFAKTLSGIWLFIGATKARQTPRHGLLACGTVVAACIAGMTLAGEAWFFMLSMLAWELGINIVSARLQAAVVQDNPLLAGPWLASAVFVGGATGPALHGAAIGAGVAGVFVVYASLSALIPAIWHRLAGSSTRVV